MPSPLTHLLLGHRLAGLLRLPKIISYTAIDPAIIRCILVVDAGDRDPRGEGMGEETMGYTHKTFAGMANAARNLTAELNAARIDNQHDYDAYNRRSDALLKELNALWSNPADEAEASKLADDLVDAWHKATGELV